MIEARVATTGDEEGRCVLSMMIILGEVRGIVRCRVAEIDMVKIQCL